jgi:transcriptional regulator with XRE-family HTH domain
MRLVTTVIGKVAARRVARRALTAFGADVYRLRTDAGVPRNHLARVAGIDQSYLARIEKGTADPSSETRARIALALGADLSERLYPNTGPAIRDRYQAPIAEAILAITHPRWHRFAEVAVRQPSRGWIDLALHDPPQQVLVATEIQSDLRRLEQLIRWSTAKADSLPSWDGWTHLGSVTVSRLLVVRDTRATRQAVDAFRRLLRTAYPGDGREALESLTGVVAWPGAALLWAVPDRARPGAYRIVARA